SVSKNDVKKSRAWALGASLPMTAASAAAATTRRALIFRIRMVLSRSVCSCDNAASRERLPVRRCRNRLRRHGGVGGPVSLLHLRQHHNPGADVHPTEQVDDVFVSHADATARDKLADRRRIIGAVDAIGARAEIHGARAEWISRTASDPARQIRLACDHI